MSSDVVRRIGEVVAFVALLGVLVSGPVTVGGAESGHGVVTGSIRIWGGVAYDPPGGYPSSGRVVFQKANGPALTVGVGTSGDFTVKLRPGVYTAFGGPPGWFPNCRANDDKPFRIRADHSYKVVVACDAI